MRETCHTTCIAKCLSKTLRLGYQTFLLSHLDLRMTSLRVYHEMKIRQIPKTVFIGCVRGYQYLISPLLPPACRFTPTCSAYTIQAVEKYGVFRGAFKGLWRLLRCHPFSRGGYDPVL